MVKVPLKMSTDRYTEEPFLMMLYMVLAELSGPMEAIMKETGSPTEWKEKVFSVGLAV